MTERRFPPSAARLRKARREGKVIKSRLVTAVSGWVSAALFLYLTLPWVRSGTLIHWFKFKVLTPEGALISSLIVASSALVLFIGAVALGCMFIGSVQTRGLLALHQVLPDIKRLRPDRYLARVKESGVDTTLGVIRVGVLFVALAPILVAYVMSAEELVWVTSDVVALTIMCALRGLLWWTLLVCALLAGVAYWCVWWKFQREHRMSHEEIREEMRESEGDLHSKAARKHEHQAMTMEEIERRVRRSKVIIVRKRAEVR